MGANVILLGILDKSHSTVRDILELEETANPQDPVIMMDLPKNWLVVQQWFDYHYSISDEKKLARLSTGGEVIVSGIVDQACYVATSLWNDGAKVWEVIFHPDEGGLSATGNLPDRYNELKQKIRAQYNIQENDDINYSLIPTQLFEDATSFRFKRLHNPCDKADFKYFRAVVR